MRLAAIFILSVAIATTVSGPSRADVEFVGHWTGKVGKGRPVVANLIVNEAGDYKVEYGDKGCIVMLAPEDDTGSDEGALLFKQKVVHGRCDHDAPVSLARTDDPDKVLLSYPGIPLKGILSRVTAEPLPRPEHGAEEVRQQVPRGKVHEFLYQEAGTDAGIGVEPIDVLHQQLADENYKCIAAVTLDVGNSKVFMSKRTTQLTFNQFGYKRYVVHCTGDCDGLEYQLQTPSEIVHFASTTPIPMIAMRNRSLGSGSIRFHIPAAAVGRDATVRIFQWTRGPGDYGFGCAGAMRE